MFSAKLIKLFTLRGKKYPAIPDETQITGYFRSAPEKGFTFVFDRSNGMPFITSTVIVSCRSSHRDSEFPSASFLSQIYDDLPSTDVSLWPKRFLAEWKEGDVLIATRNSVYWLHDVKELSLEERANLKLSVEHEEDDLPREKQKFYFYATIATGQPQPSFMVMEQDKEEFDFLSANNLASRMFKITVMVTWAHPISRNQYDRFTEHLTQIAEEQKKQAEQKQENVKELRPAVNINDPRIN